MSHTVAEQLQLLGQRGVLITAAKQGEIPELCCDMPECLCPEGRHHFEKKTHPPKDWAPSADHHPKLKKDGGKLVLGNVRLAHVLCNRVGYTESHGIKNAKDRAKVARLRSNRQSVDVRGSLTRCRECPLADHPSVPGDGPSESDFVVVGQAPGDKEVELGKPFVGSAGITLRDLLRGLGVRDSRVHFTNTVLCHPGKNERTKRDRRPPTAAIVACHERLKREIEGTEARWILAVGAVAAEALTGERVSVSEQRCSVLGIPLRPDGLDGDACVGITHHPSASLPRALLVADIRTLLSFRCDGRTPDVY